jgi:hypothetical protein
VYVGIVGQIFVATLHVSDGTSVFDAIYPTQIVDPTSNPDPRIAIAVDQGLWSLHSKMIRGTYATGPPGYGLPYAELDGSLCEAAEAFVRHGSDATGNAANTDPYSDDIARLMNETFATMTTTQVSATAPFDYDQNGNGLGVSFGLGGFGNGMVEYGPCSQVFVVGLGASYIIPAGPDGVHGRTLADVSQDLADCVSQLNSGPGLGWGDNARLTFEAVLALSNAQKLGATFSPYVTSMIDSWLLSSRAAATGPFSGAWAYTSAGDAPGITWTAAGIFESVAAGQSTADANLDGALSFIYRNWNTDDADTSGGGTASLFNCSVTVSADDSATNYLLQLAFGATETTILGAGSAGFDWFYAPLSAPRAGIASVLTSIQNSDGSWSDGSDDPCSGIFGESPTAWNASTLLGGNP